MTPQRLHLFQRVRHGLRRALPIGHQDYVFLDMLDTLLNTLPDDASDLLVDMAIMAEVGYFMDMVDLA